MALHVKCVKKVEMRSPYSSSLGDGNESNCSYVDVPFLLPKHYFHACIHFQEYTPNGDLYSAMKSAPGGRFNETTAARFTSQMVRALKYVNSKKLIHTDVKPENFLIDSQGTDEEVFVLILTEEI